MKTLHPLHRLNRFERAMEWLHEFEPQCAGSWSRTRDKLEDFLALRHFAHGCARVFSPDRWLLVGRSGRLHRSVLFARVRFHRHGQRLITDLIVRSRRGEDVVGADRSVQHHAICACSRRSSGSTTGSTR